MHPAHTKVVLFSFGEHENNDWPGLLHVRWQFVAWRRWCHGACCDQLGGQMVRVIYTVLFFIWCISFFWDDLFHSLINHYSCFVFFWNGAQQKKMLDQTRQMIDGWSIGNMTKKVTYAPGIRWHGIGFAKGQTKSQSWKRILPIGSFWTVDFHVCKIKK